MNEPNASVTPRQPPNLGDAATLPPAPPSSDSATLPPAPTQPHVPEPGSATETIASVASGTVSVPGYEILGELGRGGMGVVYKARHTKLNRLVALKMILAGGHAGAEDLARFRTEAEAIARLQHPNIVQVFEIGDCDGKPYFSLEFCGGGSLAQKLDGTPLPPKEAARIVETLARAMAAAHQKNIIHRDLKPANILLQEEFTTEPTEHTEKRKKRSNSPSSSVSSVSSVVNCIPKITDFGLAKKLDDVGQTQAGSIMGTPSYMSPEQAGMASGDGKPGGSSVGPATDIYALGAILYELLTGRPPFKAATPLDTILQVITDEPVPPRQLQSKTPRDLETISLKCLRKEAHKRYASAADLADDLQRFLDDEPIRARPISRAERCWRWCRRNRLSAALLATAGVAVIAFATFFALRHIRELRLERAARVFVERLSNKQFAQAAEMFDPKLGPVPPKQLETVWSQQTGKLGPFKKQGGVTHQKEMNYDFVYVTCNFEKGDLFVKVNLNAAEKSKAGGCSPPPDKRLSGRPAWPC